MDNENTTVLPNTAPTDTSSFSGQPQLNTTPVVDASTAEADIQKNTEFAQNAITQSNLSAEAQQNIPAQDFEFTQIQNLSGRAQAQVRNNDLLSDALSQQAASLQTKINKGFAEAPEVVALQKEYERAAKAMKRDNQEILAETGNSLYNRGAFRYQSEAATGIFESEVKAGEERLVVLEEKYDGLIAKMRQSLEDEAYEDLKDIRKEIKDVQSESNSVLKDQITLIRNFNNDFFSRQKDSLSIQKTTLDIYDQVADSLATTLAGQNIPMNELANIASQYGVPVEVLAQKLRDREMSDTKYFLDLENTQSIIDERDSTRNINEQEADQKALEGNLFPYRFQLSNAGVDVSKVSDKELAQIAGLEEEYIKSYSSELENAAFTAYVQQYAEEKLAEQNINTKALEKIPTLDEVKNSEQFKTILNATIEDQRNKYRATAVKGFDSGEEQPTLLLTQTK